MSGEESAQGEVGARASGRPQGRPQGSGNAAVGQSIISLISDDEEMPQQVVKRGRGRPKKVSRGEDNEPRRKPGRPLGSVRTRPRQSGQTSNEESENEVDMTGLSQDLTRRVKQFPHHLLENRKRTKAFLSNQADENTIERILERVPDVEDDVDDVWTAEDVEAVRSTFDDSEAWTQMRNTPIVNNHYFWSMWRGICYVTGVTPMHIISPRRLLEYGTTFETDGSNAPRTDWSIKFCEMLTRLALASPCGNNMALLSWFIRYTAACFEDDRRCVPFGDHETGHQFLNDFACAMRVRDGARTIPDVLEAVLDQWPSPPWYAAVMKIVGAAGLRLGLGSFKKSAGQSVYKPYRITLRMLGQLIEAFDGATEQGSAYLQPIDTMYAIRKPRIREQSPKDMDELNTLRKPMLLAELCFLGKMKRRKARQVPLPSLQLMWQDLKKSLGRRVKRIAKEVQAIPSSDEDEDAPAEAGVQAGTVSPILGAGGSRRPSPYVSETPSRHQSDTEQFDPPHDLDNDDVPQDAMELDDTPPSHNAGDVPVAVLELTHQVAELGEKSRAHEEEIVRLKSEAEERERDHSIQMADAREMVSAQLEFALDSRNKKRQVEIDVQGLERENVDLERELKRAKDAHEEELRRKDLEIERELKRVKDAHDKELGKKHLEIARLSAALREAQEETTRGTTAKLDMDGRVAEAEKKAEERIAEEKKRRVEAVREREEAKLKAWREANNAVLLVIENECLKTQLREAHGGQNHTRSVSDMAHQLAGSRDVGNARTEPTPRRERVWYRTYRGRYAARIDG